MSDTPSLNLPQPGPGRSADWAAAAGYLAVALALLWPLPLRMATHMLGDPFGDPLLNAWILGWDADRLRHGLEGLWQAPLFYPARDTLAWSEHLLGIAVFVAPVYWITGNIVLVYNVALVGSVVLAGIGMYMLGREVTGRRDAAWLAGLLFACLPYRVAQLSHLQVLYSGWMPLALLGLHRYFRTGSRLGLAGFVAAYVLTALSNGYYLFFLAIPVVIIAGWHLGHLAWRGGGVVRSASHLAAAALAIGLALAPVIAAYLRVREAYGFTRTRGEMVLYSATPADYTTVVPTLRVWANWLPRGSGETELFPGLTLLLLAATACLSGWRRHNVRLYAAVALTAFVLTMGPRPDVGFGPLSTGPYDLLLLVPGLSGLRVPTRMAMIVYLSLAVLASVGAAWLLPRLRPRLAVVLLLLATTAAILEGLPDLGLTQSPTTGMNDERRAYAWLRSQPSGPMLELPVGRTREASLYLARTLEHGNRIVNGYSGYGWALQDFFGGAISNELSLSSELLRAARAVGLRYVLVHGPLYRDKGHGADLAAALRADQEHVEHVRDFGATTVLVLRSADSVVRRIVLDPLLPLSGCTVHASHNSATASRAVDGEIGSRWLTGKPQQGDEWFVVRCADTRILTGLDFLVERRSHSDFARRLAIDVSPDGASFATAWEGGVGAEMATSVARGDRITRIRLEVPPAPFKVVRLRQTGQTPRNWFWSIDELQLRGR